MIDVAVRWRNEEGGSGYFPLGYVLSFTLMFYCMVSLCIQTAIFCDSAPQRVIGRCMCAPVTLTRQPPALKSTSQCTGQRARPDLCPLVMAAPIQTTSGEEKSQCSR